MVLTNLGQTAMTATDVMMMGRLGADTLAGGALGANLYFAPLIFGLGLMLATSPMMATELGRKRHSVRDLRRTVRQGLWLAVLDRHPDLAAAVARRGDPAGHGAGTGAGRSGRAPMCARCNGRLLPFYCYIVLRSFISALERPGWALVVVFVGRRLQRRSATGA